jgi:hypothetical protein
MNDRHPYSLLEIRELGHGIHDLPTFDTSEFRFFAVRLDPHESRLPIDRSAETLLLVVEGNLRGSLARSGPRDDGSRRTRHCLDESSGRRAAVGGRRGRQLPRAGEPNLENELRHATFYV